jgi:hypothetical protein
MGCISNSGGRTCPNTTYRNSRHPLIQRSWATTPTKCGDVKCYLLRSNGAQFSFIGTPRHAVFSPVHYLELPSLSLEIFGTVVAPQSGFPPNVEMRYQLAPTKSSPEAIPYSLQYLPPSNLECWHAKGGQKLLLIIVTCTYKDTN